jgi:anti-sigma B factor antagonist
MFSTKDHPEFLEIILGIDSIDASNAAELKSGLNSLDLHGAEHAVIDLSAVEFIDSSGIGALLSFYKKMNQKVKLKRPSPTVLSVLELLRLHRVFEIESE